ncbi:hypothetical protein [Bacillus thuringiensis]|uniref:hypothetical protein n=1 Tax=Bacillus thuringiensis TaxID=1428 RepID=UPI003A80E3F1
MRIVFGYIEKSGITKSGGDTLNGHFDVTHIGKGIYDIHFEPHFNSIPAIISTQLWDESGLTEGGSTLDNVVMVKLENDMVRIKTGGDNGIGTDRAFTFVAIGH